MRPFKRGMKGFWTGKELSNPFTEGTQNYRDWELGFSKAYFTNKEKVIAREKAYANKTRKGS